ncbi:ATP-binding protein [Streptomyces sp. NPDC048243]|uniref:ATP-binding protein n=1 Tax=Streptomyces sp. NPDC048243 TaxID=3365522 RepID=UPI00371A5F0D
MIFTNNKPFGRWEEVFGDETVAAAMIDRLVHHAEVHSLKGDSYRMRGANSDASRRPPPTTTGTTDPTEDTRVRFHRSRLGPGSAADDSGERAASSKVTSC